MQKKLLTLFVVLAICGSTEQVYAARKARVQGIRLGVEEAVVAQKWKQKTPITLSRAAKKIRKTAARDYVRRMGTPEARQNTAMIDWVHAQIAAQALPRN